jgi:hypothetical protein
MNKVYIVRSGSGSYEPESYVLGLYPTVELAHARIERLEDNGFDPDELWFDEVEVSSNGADCMLSNR